MSDFLSREIPAQPAPKLPQRKDFSCDASWLEARQKFIAIQMKTSEQELRERMTTEQAGKVYVVAFSDHDGESLDQETARVFKHKENAEIYVRVLALTRHAEIFELPLI